jgi:hypothetical protein
MQDNEYILTGYRRSAKPTQVGKSPDSDLLIGTGNNVAGLDVSVLSSVVRLAISRGPCAHHSNDYTYRIPSDLHNETGT